MPQGVGCHPNKTATPQPMPGLLDVKEKSASLLPGASRFLAKSNNGILAYYNYTSQSGREHTTLMISAERKQL